VAWVCTDKTLSLDRPVAGLNIVLAKLKLLSCQACTNGGSHNEPDHIVKTEQFGTAAFKSEGSPNLVGVAVESVDLDIRLDRLGD
jgi:hypothetical protein